MTSAIARPRYVHCFVAAIVLTGCRYSTPFTPVRVVDVVREFDRADKRPADGFAIGQHQIGAVAYPTIAAAVPSRLTLTLPLPRRGVFHARVALAERQPGAHPAAVRIRVGVSDHRIYEGLADLKLVPDERTWVDVRADLSAYAGWKWSLFYRPDRVTWRVVLAADATEDVPATVLWASPEIVTDTKSAREYAARRQKLR